MPATQASREREGRGEEHNWHYTEGIEEEKKKKDDITVCGEVHVDQSTSGHHRRDAGVGGTSSQRVRRTRAFALCNRACTARSENGECRHSATTSADDWMADW